MLNVMVKGRDIICKLDSVPILPRKLSTIALYPAAGVLAYYSYSSRVPVRSIANFILRTPFLVCVFDVCLGRETFRRHPRLTWEKICLYFQRGLN